jgi:hypothetical protein
MQNQVLKNKLSMPSDDALEGWRLNYLAEQNQIKPASELQREAHNAAKKLTDILSKFRAMNMEYKSTAILESASPVVLKILEKRIAEIGESIDFMNRFSESGFLGDFGIGASRGWQWLADVLPEDFENAMKSTNTNFKAAASHSGPFTRFVEAIAPFVTGDHPPSDSVASYYRNPNSRTKVFKDRREAAGERGK